MPLGIWMHSVEINDGSIRCGCTCYLHRPQSCLRRTLRRCLVKAPSAFSHPTHLSAQAKQSGAIELQLSSVSAQMVSHGFTVVLPWCHLKDLKAGSALSCKRQLIWLMANHSHRSTSWFLAKTLGQADSFGWNEWKASCWFMRCDFTIGHVFHRVSHFRSKIFKTLAPPISPTFISRWQCKKAAAAALT